MLQDISVVTATALVVMLGLVLGVCLMALRANRKVEMNFDYGKLKLKFKSEPTKPTSHKR
jgi:hypothetical protein